MMRVNKIEMIFYNSGGWRSDSLGRVTCYGGMDSMLWFCLERGDDGKKHYQMMKQRQQAHLGLMEKKHDVVQRRDDVGQRRAGIKERKERDNDS
jgi:hypothetical protein